MATIIVALDRQQAALGAAPLLERLELHRRDGEVGHVEPGEHVLGRLGVVVGRPADQREAGQRHQGVDQRLAVTQEEPLDRRTRIEPGGKGRDHAQAARLQRRDDAVVVTGVAGQQVGAHQQQADRAARAGAGHAGSAAASSAMRAARRGW